MIKIGAPILALLVLVLFYLLFEDSINWAAFGALASLFVVIWAVSQIYIIKWIDRPILRIKDYENGPPFFRPAPEIDKETRQVISIGYYVNLQIINEGKTVAKNAEPYLSSFWEFRNGDYHRDKNWIPVRLRWIFDQPQESENLMPWKPYRFNLLNLSTSHPDEFRLLLIFLPTGQLSSFRTGRYCFEVTVFAEDTKPLSRYYFVDFLSGGISEDFASVRNKFVIHDSKKSPNDC